MRGTSAIVGIGESTYYRPGGSPDSELQLAVTAITNAAAGCGHRRRGDRRLRLLRQRPQHALEALDGAGRQRDEVRGALLGRRRQQRRGHARDRGRGGHRGLRGLRGLLPQSRAGRVRALRAGAGHGPRARARGGRVPHPLRRDGSGALVRDDRPALHVRAQHHRARPRGDLARRLRARAAQSSRDPPRPRADEGRLPQLALDRRAVPALRLLPGERLLRRRDRDQRRARPRAGQAAGLHPLRRAGHRLPRRGRRRRRRGLQRPRLPDRALQEHRGHDLVPRRRRSRRTCRSRSSTRTSPASR